ncbi:DNA-directed RNA polymerase subunit delta [Anaerovibrio sp.]|uniref:DNA-directed RNA polymerase subunit delta n=1 Tax=Anaerovibrio sp. TaxID=1872532 RepID=UPI0025E0694A|nr:DNA-directed RNA polymerase subunit delta [Anaerovibrio sp.]
MNSTDVEVAAYILAEHNADLENVVDSSSYEPMYFKDLILEVIKRKKKPVQSLPEAISEIYTQINMDGRFTYRNDGKWGLTEWYPMEKKSSRGARTTSRESAAHEKKKASDTHKFESIQENN